MIMVSFNCPKCGSSTIVKRGTRKNKLGIKQRYRCNSCLSTFVEPNGFERMRHDPKIIVRAVHQHIDGFSLFKTKYHLYQHDNVKVTRRTISQWTKKYSVFLKSTTHRSKAEIKRQTTS